MLRPVVGLCGRRTEAGCGKEACLGLTFVLSESSRPQGDHHQLLGDLLSVWVPQGHPSSLLLRRLSALFLPAHPALSTAPTVCVGEQGPGEDHHREGAARGGGCKPGGPGKWRHPQRPVSGGCSLLLSRGAAMCQVPCAHSAQAYACGLW